MARYESSSPGRSRSGCIVIAVIVALVLIGARASAGFIIEFEWWREMGQVSTWLDMLTYAFVPRLAATLLAFAVLFTAHARGLKLAGTGLRRMPGYAKLSTVGLLLISWLLAQATINPWTVALFFGGRGLPAEATAWKDPLFAKPLGFYLFDLPFYSDLRGYLLGLVIAAALIYWVTARFWYIRDRYRDFEISPDVDMRTLLGFDAVSGSRFLRVIGAAVLLALALRFFLGRYELLLSDHGFMVGAEWVDENLSLPLQWAVIGACIVAAGFMAIGRWKWVILVAAALLVRGIVPAIVTAVYVRPNENTIERPYIQRHIQATRAAFGLDKRLREIEFKVEPEPRIDVAANKEILDNVRLWDWRAFHDTITQIQALRPYYTFFDTDVDRYMIDGRMRQVMLTPREIDLRLLPEAARARWINRHFIYTHGYGMVMASAARITPEGMPVLYVQDAPARVRAANLKLTRPQLYYSEVTHEPVFVRTGQPEFDYPSGADNVFTKYEGRGGFPVANPLVRIAAALTEANPNILLTGYLSGESRMMIRRNIQERVRKLAGFLAWDEDPYLVLTDEGRLVWTLDAYTYSSAHPYSRDVALRGIGSVNYMRNAVKATVDAYSGETRLYVFDPGDPIIRAYQALFPTLFRPAKDMPADLRMHARYPEDLFRVQAEVYRTYHMLDPQAFYNREDMWDIARTVRGQGGQAAPMDPSYVVATIPGSREPEFLQIVPFTPRNKDNMIGVMVARCDGEHLGELLELQVSKQELIFGPMQIEARINQDQQISKDLTLWNQQGSEVVRGQVFMLPLENSFLAIQPLYIQSQQARMPELKKVALLTGTNLIYTDTYEQAVAALGAAMGQTIQAESAQPAAPAAQQAAAQPAPAQAAKPPADPELQRRMDSIRERLKRYRDFAAQGRWSEAGKELEAIEREAGRR